MSATDVIAAARALVAEEAISVHRGLAAGQPAAFVARSIVADAAALNTAAPPGVALSADPAPEPTSPPVSPRGPDAPRPAAGIPATEEGAARALKIRGPATELTSCPYCAEPRRRFCPESGRRHETTAERALRLWHTVYRQSLFSMRMTAVARVEQPNTCTEEFFVEL